MPIEIACPKCQRKLRAPDGAEGKKVKCPQCQEILVVPGGPPATISIAPEKPGAAIGPEKPAAAGELATAVAPSPSPVATDRWYVKTRDGTDYGPITKAELDVWVQEQRLDSQSQVLKDGAGQWQWATDLYPQLEAPAGGVAAAMPQPTSPVGPFSAPMSAPASAGPFDLAVGTTPSAAGQPFGQPYPSGATGYTAGYTPGPSPLGGAGAYSAPQYAGGYGVSSYGGEMLSDKSKVTAGILGIVLGGFGVHRFYLGFIGIGFAQIAVTLLTCGIGGWWGVIEGIMILAGSIDRDAMGRKLRD